MIRTAEKRDHDKMKELWLSNYGEAFTEQYFEKYLRLYQNYVLEEDGEFLASLSYRPHEYVLNGKILRISYILKPVIVPEHRHEGRTKQILEPILEKLSSQELLTFIGTDHPMMYGTLGFEKIYKRKNYVLSKRNVPTLNTYEVSFEAGEEDMLKCYGKFTSHFNGYKLRSFEDFRELRSLKAKEGGQFVYFFTGDDLTAYASYQELEDHIEVGEIIYLDSLSFVSILSYFLDRKDEVRMSISAAENLSFLNPNLSYEESDLMMARINDYRAFNSLYGSNVSSVPEGYLLSRKHPYGNEAC